MNAKKRLFCLCLMTATALLGAKMHAKESVVSSEFRLTLQDLTQDLKGAKSEIEILQDKIDDFSNELASIKEKSAKDGLLEGESAQMARKVTSLEITQKALLEDLKTLKNSINESNLTIAKCEAKISDLNKELSSELKNVKNSLQSMLAYVQKGSTSTPESNIYIVKNGDSLGKIAQEHKVSIKKLKDANALSSDQIFPGQKIQIP